MISDCLTPGSPMRRNPAIEEFGKQRRAYPMNYEELYKELQDKEKELKDAVKAVTRLDKSIAKEIGNGNLTEMKKDLEQILQTIDTLKEKAAAIDEAVNAFDAREYFASGDFTRQLLQACEERNINVIGEKGVYEMFPYKIRIYGDDEHPEEVWMNRKKVASVRPAEVADTVKKGQEKLYKVKFNEATFMKELAEGYDATCKKEKNIRYGAKVSLTKIYKTMVPMARSRKEYDMQAFAFDLARIYELGPDHWVTKDGRRFNFGTSRDGKNAIRVLSKTGVESFIANLSLMNTEE